MEIISLILVGFWSLDKSSCLIIYLGLLQVALFKDYFSNLVFYKFENNLYGNSDTSYR